jgi:beta-lactamase class A
MGLVNHPGTPKLWAIAHKNGHKRKNGEFFVIPLQNVQTVIFILNLHGTPKQWAIAHKTALKRKNDEIFVMPLKRVRVSWTF